MSKAMLIIDMPECCDECDIICEQYYSAIRNENFDNNMKPDICPLRELPKKKEVKDVLFLHSEYFDLGHNACIDDILEK